MCKSKCRRHHSGSRSKNGELICARSIIQKNLTITVRFAGGDLFARFLSDILEDFSAPLQIVRTSEPFKDLDSAQNFGLLLFRPTFSIPGRRYGSSAA